MGYNIIKKLFWWRKKEEAPPEEPEPEFSVSILIGGTKDGDLDIKCEWQAIFLEKEEGTPENRRGTRIYGFCYGWVQ